MSLGILTALFMFRLRALFLASNSLLFFLPMGVSLISASTVDFLVHLLHQLFTR